MKNKSTIDWNKVLILTEQYDLVMRGCNEFQILDNGEAQVVIEEIRQELIMELGGKDQKN